LGGDVAAEAEGVGFFAHRADAEADVFLEWHAKLFRAFANIFAAHAFGEGFVFEAALHGVHLEIKDALRRANVRAGREEAGELVAGEKRVFEGRLPNDAGIIGVREDRANDFVGVAVLAQNFRAFRWMPRIGNVFVVGPALVVEIVEQGGDAPKLFIGALFACIGADAGFDRQHVLAEALRVGEFAQQLPGIVACRHAFLQVSEPVV
jgi:hypothetical protein